MAKHQRVLHRFKISDISQVLIDYLDSLQSPDGSKFVTHQVLDDTIVVRIANQSFIISISEKDGLS
jgi:hypothetical protein